jgi:hypothetical protein
MVSSCLQDKHGMKQKLLHRERILEAVKQATK